MRYSQVLAEWLLANESPQETLQAVGWEVMQSRQEELNIRLIAKIAPGRDVAVDGLRHPIDEGSLRASFAANFYLLYVEAPTAIRWQRKLSSKRFESYRAFIAADEHPVEQPHRTLHAHAFAVIQNAGSVEDYYATLSSNLEKLRSGNWGGKS